MPADITLNGDDGNAEWVIVEGSVLKAETSDLMLDSPGRRSADTGFRRAMVHDFKDGLTINFNGDYPGGVTVGGSPLKAQASDFMLDSPSRRSTGGGHRRAMVHDFEDGLTINFNGDYPGGVTIKDARVNLKYVTQGVDAELPKNGTPGDLLFIYHGSLDEVVLSHASLWLCVPHDVTLSGNAWWQEIPLNEPVEGTA